MTRKQKVNTQMSLQPEEIIKQNILSDKIDFSRNSGVIVFHILHKSIQIMKLNKSKLTMI